MDAAAFEHLRPRFAQFLRNLDRFSANFARIGANDPPQPRWDQVWFPRLDACAAYAMVRDTAPRLIVEIGSGHSTRFMARAVADGGFSTRFISVDPAPRAALDGLAIERVALPVQETVLPALTAGDILFVDSSHIRRSGSDVEVIFARLLPALPPGALLHFHDIFLPDPYPTIWDYRGYNEQQSVERILAGLSYEILFASRFVATRMEDEIARSAAARLPIAPEAFENSLWLRKL